MFTIDHLLLAGLIVLLIGIWLSHSLRTEGAYSWYRQPDEFWFSAVSIGFSVLAGLAMFVGGILHG